MALCQGRSPTTDRAAHNIRIRGTATRHGQSPTINTRNQTHVEECAYVQRPTAVTTAFPSYARGAARPHEQRPPGTPAAWSKNRLQHGKDPSCGDSADAHTNRRYRAGLERGDNQGCHEKQEPNNNRAPGTRT